MLPVLFQQGTFVLHSYPLLVGIAWGVSFVLSKYYLMSQGLTEKRFHIYFWGSFISAFLGAKLLFIFNSYQGAYENIIFNSNFWLGGGYVFYGGLIGAFVYGLFSIKVLKIVKLSQLHVLMPVLALCHSIGRIGCLLAGCCYGNKTSGLLSIHLHHADRHPVQLYESILLFVLFIILRKLIVIKIKYDKVFVTYFVGYALIRFILEFMRGDEIRGYIYGLSSSQFVSLIILLLATVYYYLNNRRGHCGKV